MHVRKRLFQFAALPAAVVAVIAVGVAPASADLGGPGIDIGIDINHANEGGGGGGGGVNYKKAYTGRDCKTELWWDGQQWQEDGTRCAQAYVRYVASGATLWKIDDYYIRYDVTGDLSYGPHNNERPWKVVGGYKSGDESYNSPDAGTTNSGYFLRDQGTTYTYQGQTVINIDAWPDIPGESDPRLDLDTASF